MSRPEAIITTVLPDKERIPRNLKREKVSENLIKGRKLFKNKTTQDKGQNRIVSLMLKYIIQKTPPPFTNK